MTRRYDSRSKRRYQGLWLGQKFSVRVDVVLDGRTVHVESVERPRDYLVRLYGVSVPDKSKNEPYWKESSDYLAGLVLNRELSMEVKDFDIRRSQIVVLLQSDSAPDKSVSHAMVAAGWALADPRLLGSPEIRQLESEARILGFGFWQT